jgi:hypothetical protein
MVNQRKVFILHLWSRGRDAPIWIGEVKDVSTGEMVHTQSLQELFDYLTLKTEQMQPSSQQALQAVSSDPISGEKKQ